LDQLPLLNEEGREAVERVEGPVDRGASAPIVPHEGFVVPDHLQGVLELPAVATVVLETG